MAAMYLASYVFGEIYVVVTFCCCCQTSLRTFLEEFEAYQAEHCRGDWNHKFVLVWGIVSLICMLISSAAAAYYALSTTMVAECRHAFHRLSEGLDTFTCHPVCFGLSLFYFIVTYGAAFFLYISVWRILNVEANSIVENLSKQDRITLREKPEVIEDFRLRHAALCRVIGSANRVMRHILAAFYGAGITCMLLSVHGLINKQIGKVEVIAMGATFFTFVTYLIVITLTGVSLNQKMHEPVDFLFCLDVQRMSGKGSEIVSMFLSRVQGAPIGFNVYNLFTVDTSTIMMICGTLLTYALVIVQF
ncbi:hypothetical protein V1264_016455 [Littorina saxatilis]|uniref:Gustatory receptor n=2 Tax=Littorina saxatilis TaxID=31220 RepID=A0AAN9BPC4_9CAEN